MQESFFRYGYFARYDGASFEDMLKYAFQNEFSLDATLDAIAGYFAPFTVELNEWCAEESASM